MTNNLDRKPGSDRCALLSVGASLLAPILFGLSIGYTGAVLDTMKGEIQNMPPAASLKVFDTKMQASLFSAVLNIGGMFGSLGGGKLAESFGRRRTLVILSPVFVTSWLILALSRSFGFLVLGRGINGLAVGAASVVAPMYIGEIAPTHLRGALGASNQLAITIGILAAYLLGLVCVTDAGSPHGKIYSNWTLHTYLMLVPSILLFVGMALAPETPRWLASKGRLNDAERTLFKLRGNPSEEELQELRSIKDRHEIDQTPNEPSVTPIALKDCRVQLVIGIGLQVLQQFTGINAVMYYMPRMFTQAGVGNVGLWSFLACLIQVLVTVLAVILMDRLGRRKLLLSGASGLTVSVFTMGLASFLLLQYNISNLGWLFIISVFSYLTFFSIGVGPIPWLILSEIFPDNVRAVASAIATTANWGCGFLVTFYQENLDMLLKPYGQLWLYAIFGAILISLTYFLIPETKGKSFDEIQRHFNGKTKDTSDSTRV